MFYEDIKEYEEKLNSLKEMLTTILMNKAEECRITIEIKPKRVYEEDDAPRENVWAVDYDKHPLADMFPTVFGGSRKTNRIEDEHNENSFILPERLALELLNAMLTSIHAEYRIACREFAKKLNDISDQRIV